MFKRRSSESRGEKPSLIPERPVPDEDGVVRILPKSMWDGPNGDFLREIGASPDDPSNVMPTAESIEARFAELRKEQDAFMARVNQQYPAKLVPWEMIPAALWVGPHGAFLIVVCELYPLLPWNLMLLPEDQRGSMILGLPQHPGGIPEGLLEGASLLISDIHAEFTEAHNRTAEALAKGDTSTLQDHAKAKKLAADKVVFAAQKIAIATFGEDVYARHKAVCGGALGWNVASPE